MVCMKIVIRIVYFFVSRVVMDVKDVLIVEDYWVVPAREVS